MNYEEIKIKYQKDGYIVLENFFDIEFINKINEIVNEIISNSKNINKNDYLYDLEDAHLQNGIPQVRRIKNPVEQINELEFVIKNKKLLQLLKCFLGANIRLHHSKINMKNPILGSSVEWHQDWAFYPHTNDSVLEVGIPLANITEENGPMLVIPKSHKKSIYNHHDNGYFCGAIKSDDIKINEKKIKPLLCNIKSITLHHAKLVHGSNYNKSKFKRPLMLLGFTAADAWPLMGIKDYNKFKNNIVLGKHINEPRLSDNHVIMPLPVSRNEGSIYENQKNFKHRYFE